MIVTPIHDPGFHLRIPIGCSYGLSTLGLHFYHYGLPLLSSSPAPWIPTRVFAIYSRPRILFPQENLH
jgi:hypothetical protein